ncbi:MFS transporter [Blastococcus sp. SYSU DS0552]
MATVGFVINFWAWVLVSPLGAFFTGRLDLRALQTSLLVAVPVVVGSLGRIPVGALTDRFGARVMFPLVSALTILPVLFIGYVGNDSYALMLLGGFVLRLGGTTFAIGVPLVNAWFPPAKRGTALGIFGAGMGGTAISAFTTVQLADGVGLAFPFTLVAALLAVYAIVSALVLRDAPRPHPARALSAGALPAARVGFQALLAVLGPHVAKEEKALFPRLAQVSELTDRVAVLEGEHADLFEAVEELDDLGTGAADQWADGVLRALHDLDEHMFKGDFGLFPAALATLDGADWDAVDAWERTSGVRLLGGEDRVTADGPAQAPA